MREREGECAWVLLVNDHVLFRDGVVEIFAGEDDLEALASPALSATRIRA